MSHEVPLTDDLIRAMLERRASGVPVGRLVHDVARQIESVPQRRVNQPRGFRWFGQLALAASIGAIVVLGAVLLRPATTPAPGVGASPSPAPSSVLTPAASVRTIVDVGLDGPVMDGGVWQTLVFGLPFRFTVEDALWVPGADLPRQFYLRARLPDAPRDEFDALTLVALQNVYVDPCQRGDVGGTRLWDPSGGPQAFFDWLDENSPVDFGTPRPATVLGRPGLELEFTMPDLSECAVGFLPITDVGRPTSFSTGFPGQLTRYGVTTVNGQTVLVVTWTDDPTRWEAVKAEADEVLATIEFLG